MQDKLERRLDHLEAVIVALQEKVAVLEAETRLYLKRYLTACPVCKKEFDLLVNHYSIGLFDNLVYVKCPYCNKSMPVVDKEGGGIQVVAD
ncbi:MAG: hypothetical protein HY201_03965 [Nitrospirae bacterium]|nr:hypothetical protein [Candidatus Troglogloeales bacterium]MBI3598588.1 hypothetical protein [Candidatus Troglogloeales bacterium]